jgi:hypothetical protein
VDPSCGAGAFLDAAARRFPWATLFGLELEPCAARLCRSRQPGALVLESDALRGGIEALGERIPDDAFELWVGNPPYNGTSPALKDPELYRRLRALLPGSLARGQSLRDDFAFFLLLASQRLARREGALAFVTSATLIDAFLYSPMRKLLLDRLQLREVIELGAGVFRGAQVRTAVTVWTHARGGRAARYRRRIDERPPFHASGLSPAEPLSPHEPELLLRPIPGEALELETHWRSEGEPITTLIPISSPGLKTRFDELLVDDDPEILLERVKAFLACAPEGLAHFAREHGLPEELLPKLRALRAFSRLRPEQVVPESVRPFYRYAGARHRGQIPETARAFCYLDRELIPRGDHRFRGAWDPHACEVKLVFNVRELPLSAALLERPGCVHDHRHARFAPLYVPRRIREEGLECTRSGGELGEEVPNLSEKGLTWARELGGPRGLYEALVGFINSARVQEVWAPCFGASRVLCVTQEELRTAAALLQTRRADG